MILLTFLPPDVLAQQIRVGNHAHEPILIIRHRETTHVPTEHQLSRFLEGRFRSPKSDRRPQLAARRATPELNCGVPFADECQRRANQADIAVRKHADQFPVPITAMRRQCSKIALRCRRNR
jgi:hypothetical protein